MSNLLRRLDAIEEALKQLPTATARAGIVAHVATAFPEDRFADERPRIVAALLAGPRYHFESAGRLFLIEPNVRDGGYIIFDYPALPELPEWNETPATIDNTETPRRRGRTMTDSRGVNWKEADDEQLRGHQPLLP
jgi:hypothetical protein